MAGPIGPGDWLDPYKMRDHAAADEIKRQAEEQRRRDPNYARLQDEIDAIQREHSGLLSRLEPRDPLLRSVYWVALGGAGLGLVAGIGVIVLQLLAGPLPAPP